MHLGIDAHALEVWAIEVTDNSVGNAPMLPGLLSQIPLGELAPCLVLRVRVGEALHGLAHFLEGGRGRARGGCQVEGARHCMAACCGAYFSAFQSHTTAWPALSVCA